MAHTIHNTVKEELDKRGNTPTWLMGKMNESGDKTCLRTLMQILNNKIQDVTIKQLQTIAKVFKDTDKRSQRLKWHDMIKDNN